MGLLDRLFGVNTAASALPEPTLDPCLGDGRARHLRSQLERGQWRAVAGALDRLKREDREFYVQVITDVPGRPAWIGEWWQACNESVLPWLVRGRHAIYWAWEARSSRRASEVSQDAFRTFFERLQQAEVDLCQAAEMDPEDATPWAFQVITARGLQLARHEEHSRFEEARRRDPNSHVAHSMMLVALCEKWGGSHAEMFEFARQASGAAPEGSGLHSLLAQAHVERWLYFHMDGDPDGARHYFAEDAVREEVVEAWQRSFASPAYRPGRFAAQQRSEFAFCFYLMEEREHLREVLRALGPTVTESPWGLLGDPVRTVRKARSSCGV